jgi:hypothetical protein
MKNLPPIAYAAVALLSLAACQNKAEEVDTRAPDPMAEALKNAPKIELPPAVAASKTLRCGDNSLLYVEFFSGDKQVNVRTEKDGKPTMLKAPAAGEPYVAEGGYKLTGTPKSVDVTLPGKGSKTCHT